MQSLQLVLDWFSAMAHLAFLLAMTFLAAAGVISGANELYGSGFWWADRVCNSGICANRDWFWVAAGTMLVVHFGLSKLQV